MKYLIDGHNLIANLPDISLADEHDEMKLIMRLRRWTAVTSKRQVNLYFDGGLPGGKSRQLSTGPLQVIFAPVGQTADSLLIRFIEEVSNPKGYVLVTSDEAILKAARHRKMSFFRSDAFRLQLEVDPRPTPVAPPTDAPEISTAEVAEWLAVFGGEPPAPIASKIVAQPTPPTKKEQLLIEAQKNPKKKKGLVVQKSANTKLDQEDISAWLDFFKDPANKKTKKPK